VSQANRPYNHLDMEFSAVMVPLTKPINKYKIYLELTICLLTNQTNQQRQDITANIFNTQLSHLLQYSQKYKIHSKIEKMTTGI
jgi:hypothetical protein